MNRQIWIVEATAGEYDDHTSWPLKVFFHEANGRELQDKATKRARELNSRSPAEVLAARDRYYDQRAKGKSAPKLSDFDPNLDECNVRDVEYTVYPVEIGDEP